MEKNRKKGKQNGRYGHRIQECLNHLLTNTMPHICSQYTKYSIDNKGVCSTLEKINYMEHNEMTSKDWNVQSWTSPGHTIEWI